MKNDKNNFENLSYNEGGDFLVNGIPLESEKIEKEELTVDKKNNGFFFDFDIGDKISVKRFYFDRWEITYNRTSRKTIIQPFIFSLYSNGRYSIEYIYNSRMSTRGGLRMNMTFIFKKSDYTLTSKKHRWHITCGNNNSEHYQGTIQANHYNLISRLTISIDGRARKC